MTKNTNILPNPPTNMEIDRYVGYGRSSRDAVIALNACLGYILGKQLHSPTHDNVNHTFVDGAGAKWQTRIDCKDGYYRCRLY